MNPAGIAEGYGPVIRMELAQATCPAAGILSRLDRLGRSGSPS